MERISEESGNGNGCFYLEKILADELGDKCGLYARVTVPPGASVGYHQHVGDNESYFFLSGEGVYDDNGVKRAVKSGDATWTPSGASHGVENTGAEDLVFMALIINC
ncbi:MAG: cupin domain-containing protein [Kiritimatiellae bacterium]|nr:cupin domain-containing protein [Kiritimatiellia bacterium]MDD4025231.1 cupin domain-containing protein [Kiritimatiellia bacterium]MDD4622450.1 cupin domain-containing protein [Kiritimatiellia bacterium]